LAVKPTGGVALGRPKKQHCEPWWLKSHKCYYLQVGPDQKRLSPDKDEAWRLWHEFMAKPPEERKGAGAAMAQPEPYAVQVIDHYLDWCERNRRPKTYAWSKAHPEWEANTRHGFIAACQRAFSWAAEEGRIAQSPVPKMRKPDREARELAITPALYAEVMAAVKEPNFRGLLEFAWECGMRPQELVAVEARHVDLATCRVILPPREAKGKRRHRVVYLTDEGLAMLRPLMATRPSGPLFRNSKGGPWTKDAVNCAFCRLKEKIGRKLHLGAWRKGYATESIKAGVDLSTLAGLMGHQDGRMLVTVYSKVTQDHEHMARAARKARKPSGDA
jgi:integrase